MPAGRKPLTRSLGSATVTPRMVPSPWRLMAANGLLEFMSLPLLGRTRRWDERAGSRRWCSAPQGISARPRARELLSRGWQVSAATRQAAPRSLDGLDVRLLPGDADAPGQLERWVAGHELVIDAAAPHPSARTRASAARRPIRSPTPAGAPGRSWTRRGPRCAARVHQLVHDAAPPGRGAARPSRRSGAGRPIRTSRSRR